MDPFLISVAPHIFAATPHIFTALELVGNSPMAKKLAGVPEKTTIKIRATVSLENGIKKKVRFCIEMDNGLTNISKVEEFRVFHWRRPIFELESCKTFPTEKCAYKESKFMKLMKAGGRVEGDISHRCVSMEMRQFIGLMASSLPENWYGPVALQKDGGPIRVSCIGKLSDLSVGSVKSVKLKYDQCYNRDIGAEVHVISTEGGKVPDLTELREILEASVWVREKTKEKPSASVSDSTPYFPSDISEIERSQTYSVKQVELELVFFEIHEDVRKQKRNHDPGGVWWSNAKFGISAACKYTMSQFVDTDLAKDLFNGKVWNTSVSLCAGDLVCLILKSFSKKELTAADIYYRGIKVIVLSYDKSKNECALSVTTEMGNHSWLITSLDFLVDLKSVKIVDGKMKVKICKEVHKEVPQIVEGKTVESSKQADHAAVHCPKKASVVQIWKNGQWNMAFRLIQDGSKLRIEKVQGDFLGKDETVYDWNLPEFFLTKECKYKPTSFMGQLQAVGLVSKKLRRKCVTMRVGHFLGLVFWNMSSVSSGLVAILDFDDGVLELRCDQDFSFDRDSNVACDLWKMQYDRELEGWMRKLVYVASVCDRPVELKTLSQLVPRGISRKQWFIDICKEGQWRTAFRLQEQGNKLLLERGDFEVMRKPGKPYDWIITGFALTECSREDSTFIGKSLTKKVLDGNNRRKCALMKLGHLVGLLYWSLPSSWTGVVAKQNLNEGVMELSCDVEMSLEVYLRVWKMRYPDEIHRYLSREVSVLSL